MLLTFFKINDRWELDCSGNMKTKGPNDAMILFTIYANTNKYSFKLKMEKIFQKEKQKSLIINKLWISVSSLSLPFNLLCKLFNFAAFLLSFS